MTGVIEGSTAGNLSNVPCGQTQSCLQPKFPHKQLRVVPRIRGLIRGLGAMPLKKGKPALVGEQEAEGSTREIFSEIKQALGVPHVNLVFQAYAAHPRFLELHWRATKPILGTQEFFQLADRLRAEA